ncbi:hypothetical protein JCM10207_002039 [Rhodosporidiobolus poonsookiae]
MDSSDDDASSDSPSLFAGPSSAPAQPSASLPAAKKQKGKQTQGKTTDKDDKDQRKRSSKACDNCRKSKCKCTRIYDPATNEPVGPCQNCLTVGSECTFLGASRKRGPPKGYIEAIESRLHRMEALLGGLLGSDDPRAQTLLGELIGDTEARDVLTRDLRAAADATKPPKRSWKREFVESQEQMQRERERAAVEAQQMAALQQQQQQQTVISTGFGGPTSFPGLTGVSGAPTSGAAGAPTWLTEDDLTGLAASLNAAPADLFASPTTGGSALGFDPASFGGTPSVGAGGGPTFGTFRAPGAVESSDDAGSPGFGVSGGPATIPLSTSAGAGRSPLAGNPLLSTSSSGAAAGPDLAASPRQRRRLDLPTYAGAGGSGATGAGSPGGGGGGSVSAMNSVVAAGSPNAGFPSSFGPSSASGGAGGAAGERKQMAYAFKLPPVGAVPPRNTSSGASHGPVLSPASIGHTGSARYSVKTGEGIVGSSKGKGEEERDTPLSELADVVGQLSLNENAEVRYHGRSSGLYLISNSQRYRNFFWNFPSAGIWPPADVRVLKTEREILQLADADDPLPDMQTQTHLLSAYWTYVHPHFPLLYKISFMRQYRHGLAHPDSTEPSTPAGTGKVPTVLLLSMFALAARYCDLDEARKDGKYWTAGQDYLDKARRILNHDYGSSKLVTVQALLLISYREIGVGAMSSAWMSCGMAIRMAQDLGLFRDVEKWFLPVQRFGHEEKQTRKRVWWACIILDRYTASYIGRPGTIHERDYDCGFPSEDEPDEHEQWRPIRLDGTEWTSPAKQGQEAEFPPEEVARVLMAYPTGRAHTLSCFNAAGALAVIINRIISNIYAIRIRVLGQSSETLLSLLDQSLASWYLALPPHLQYNPASTKVPPPHILSLHLQFYSSLILLHRPFIPGQNSNASPGNFPSHSICTTAANAIANIITTWRKTFTLRQCPPFLTYPIFSAAIICVYNASFDEALARPAKIHLLQCMNALKEMELIWGSAIRAWELLHGLVDLRDADLNTELAGLNEETSRGTKRAAMDVDEPTPSSFDEVRPANFHNWPMPQRTSSVPKTAHNRKRSTSASSGGKRSASTSRPSLGASGSPMIPEHALFPAPPVPAVPSSSAGVSLGATSGTTPAFTLPSPPFSFETPPGAPIMPTGLPGQSAAGGPQAHSIDILNPSLDLSQFKSRPGTAGGDGPTNFSDLLNSFLTPTEAASTGGPMPPIMPPFGSVPGSTSGTAAAHDHTLGGLLGIGAASPAGAPPGSMANPLQTAGFDATSAFFGMPLGADMTEDWFNYSYNAFAANTSDQGGTPDSLAGIGATSANGAQPTTSPKPPVM